MAERTQAERNWQAARQEEQQARREGGEGFRAEGQRGRDAYREGGYGGGYQPGSYEHPVGRSGWQLPAPSEYMEGGYYGQGERGYVRPPGFRHQGPGYGASAGYGADEAGEWAARAGGEFRPSELRPGSYGPRGREGGGPRGGAWSGPWRTGETAGWQGPFGGTAGWRSEGPWEQDRDYGDDVGWSGAAGFRGGYGAFTGHARGGGGFTRWQGGEGSWRGGGAPGYPGNIWGRGAPEAWQQEGGGWGGEPGRGGYGQGMRSGWGAAPPELELAPWARGPREWGEPGRGGSAYGEPWTVPGPFAGRGPEGYQRSGESIRDDVCERLTRHGHVDASRIRVRVDSNNEVVLEGNVPDRRMKRLAEDIADSVSGVRDVQNRLRVSDRDERSFGGGPRSEERDSRDSREWEQATVRGGADQTATPRAGRAERDTERQKATPRAKT
jgi:hypothetical protein